MLEQLLDTMVRWTKAAVVSTATAVDAAAAGAAAAVSA
jgi:hypothetical protein